MGGFLKGQWSAAKVAGSAATGPKSRLCAADQPSEEAPRQSRMIVQRRKSVGRRQEPTLAQGILGVEQAQGPQTEPTSKYSLRRQRKRSQQRRGRHMTNGTPSAKVPAQGR